METARKGKASEKPDQKARKRGGKIPKRGLSAEQVLVLVATDRSGTAITVPLLPAGNADTLRAVLAPVTDKDALLVTDGGTGYSPCAATLGSVTRRLINRSVNAFVASFIPKDRQQSSRTPQGV